MKLIALKKILAAFTLLLVCSCTWASGFGVMTCCQPFPWYGIVGGGYAWSNNINPTIDFNSWDPAIEGYNNTLKTSPFFTLGIGKRISNYFLAQLTSSYFNDFDYSKFQTSAVASTPGFSGTSRVRYFDLTNLNAMLSLIFNNPNFGVRFCNQVSISPFIGGGIGAAVNSVKNFHTLTGVGTSTSVGISTTRTTSFAAQGETGLAFNFTPKLALDLGYRYYYGGKFYGPNNIFVTTGSGTSTTADAPAWKGSLKANLLFANIRFAV